jgi:5-(carboxyamino)imidazole ribonucleotide mutase
MPDLRPNCYFGETTMSRSELEAPTQCRPVVGILMGSQSDWPVMAHAAKTLADFGIPYEARVISAHRAPDLLFEYASSARDRGLRVLIAGAGGAAHLAGVTAAKTHLPVIGVPMESQALKGMDSLLSTVQMPAGIPVATVAIGKAGAINAALLAVSILAVSDPALEQALIAYRARQTEKIVTHPALSVDEAA